MYFALQHIIGYAIFEFLSTSVVSIVLCRISNLIRYLDKLHVKQYKHVFEKFIYTLRFIT